MSAVSGSGGHAAERRGTGGVPLVLRLATRELRAGLAGFRVFLACIALGVMAIAGVGSFARGLADGLARDGRVILGGDVAFSLIHREANPEERAFLATIGRVSLAATMRAMARVADGRAALVEIKAVDDAYPLYGKAVVEPAVDLTDVLALRDGVYGVAADEALFARLDLKSGARLKVGEAELDVRGVLKTEPDKLAGGIGFGPRLLMSEAALRVTGLLQPGSLVRWHYRVAIAGSDAGDRAAGFEGEGARQPAEPRQYQARRTVFQSCLNFSTFPHLEGCSGLV